MKKIYMATKKDLRFEARNEGVGHITRWDIELENIEDYDLVTYENDTFIKVLWNKVTAHPIGDIYGLHKKQDILGWLKK